VIQQASHNRSSYLIDEYFYDKPEIIAPKDELIEYLSLPLLPVDDHLEWWRLHQDSLPKLAIMAFDILSVPATLCKCKRLLSQSKLIMLTQRQGMQDQTIEDLICLNYYA
jgi:hypothetical protein